MEQVKSNLLSSHKNLLHTFTNRKGGFSKPPFSGNNFAYHVYDNHDDVDKNHLQLASTLHYKHQNLIRMNQVHGNKIININEESDLSIIPSCDALITNQKNIPLMVMVADCIPILIYDPINRVIAAIHAGRAGVFSKILPLTISKMHDLYHSDPKDLTISLGPSIRNCCYEVGEEIFIEAEEKKYEYAIEKKDNSYYLDLISIVKEQLKQSNTLKDNVDISSYCTACNTNLFYSYRAEKECGRFAGIIMLK